MHSLGNPKPTRRLQATITREVRKRLHLDAAPELVLVKYDGTVVVKRGTITLEV
jgi:hypothetical protein